MMGEAHSSAVEGFKKRGVKQDADDSWYLLMVMVHPEHQGKGHLSRILNEAFQRAPGVSFTLDATTTQSRDRYAHHGFEVPCNPLNVEGLFLQFPLRPSTRSSWVWGRSERMGCQQKDLQQQAVICTRWLRCVRVTCSSCYKLMAGSSQIVPKYVSSWL